MHGVPSPATTSLLHFLLLGVFLSAFPLCVPVPSPASSAVAPLPRRHHHRRTAAVIYALPTNKNGLGGVHELRRLRPAFFFLASLAFPLWSFQLFAYPPSSPLSSHKKNLKRILIVHPSALTRSLLWFLHTFASAKMSKKIFEIFDWKHLEQFIDLQQVSRGSTPRVHPRAYLW